jgi:hypothetical protein
MFLEISRNIIKGLIMQTVRMVLKNKGNGNIKTEEKHLTYFYLLEYIKKNVRVQSVTLESNIRLEYVGDFYGLLTYLNTNPKLLYINTLLNGLSSSNEYDGIQSVINFINTDNPKVAAIITRLNNL